MDGYYIQLYVHTYISEDFIRVIPIISIYDTKCMSVLFRLGMLKPTKKRIPRIRIEQNLSANRYIWTLKLRYPKPETYTSIPAFEFTGVHY